jgi:hypothetical protein
MKGGGEVMSLRNMRVLDGSEMFMVNIVRRS